MLNNSLGDGADAILSVASEMPQIITLCGIQPEQTDINFSSGNLDAADAKLLAFDLSRNQSVRTVKCSVGWNRITGDAAEKLANVVLEHASMTDFCGIPLVSLHENSITELNLEKKGVGAPGAIVLSKLLPSAAALTSLKCACRPASVRLSVSAR